MFSAPAIFAGRSPLSLASGYRRSARNFKAYRPKPPADRRCLYRPKKAQPPARTGGCACWLVRVEIDLDPVLALAAKQRQDALARGVGLRQLRGAGLLLHL